MGEARVRIEREGAVALVTLNDPASRNALTPGVMRDANDPMYAGTPHQMQEGYRNGVQMITKLFHALDVPVIPARASAARAMALHAESDTAAASPRDQRGNMTDQENDWVSMEDEGFIGLVGPLFMTTARGGRGRFRFVAAEKHRNRNDVVHGGMLMTFADRALGFTARQGDMGLRQATIQFDMHFVRAARIGETIEMDCHVTRATRSLIFVEGVMTAGGETVATAKGIWKITGRSAEGAPD